MGCVGSNNNLGCIGGSNSTSIQPQVGNLSANSRRLSENSTLGSNHDSLDRDVLSSKEISSYLDKAGSKQQQQQQRQAPFVNDLCVIRGDAPSSPIPAAGCGCTGFAHRPECTLEFVSRSKNKLSSLQPRSHASRYAPPVATNPPHRRGGSVASIAESVISKGTFAGAGEGEEDEARPSLPDEYKLFSRENSKIHHSLPHAPAGPENELIDRKSAPAPRALITSRAMPFTDQMAVNIFLHDSEASLVVDANGQIVNANFAAYNLFEMNPSIDLLKNSKIQSRLASFPKALLTANLQPGLWMSDRYVESAEPPRTKKLKWSAWRIDVKDSRQPPPCIDNSPGAPPRDLLEEDEGSAEHARWLVRLKDVTDEQGLLETVHALKQALIQQKEELGARAFESVKLRECMLSGRAYRKRVHSTAIIGFLDIQGSTRYNKVDTTQLLQYTRKIVSWSWDVDELSVDQSILKLEMVGDAVVFAFGLYDPLLMKHTNALATLTATPIFSPVEGESEENKIARSGTITPDSPTTSAAPTTTTTTTTTVTPAAAAAAGAVAPTKRLGTASSMSAVVDGVTAYEMRVKSMLIKSCEFLFHAMAQAADKYNFKLRAGLHMGTVTTSCCGKKMPKLMVIGTPADFASRLQNQGTPGAIHMSAAIARQYLGAEAKMSISNSVRAQFHNFEPLETCLVTPV